MLSKHSRIAGAADDRRHGTAGLLRAPQRVPATLPVHHEHGLRAAVPRALTVLPEPAPQSLTA